MHFYNRAESISYPIDDGASGLTDAGEWLRSNVIVDLNLRWPNTLGDYAFVSAVAVTAGLVTVSILAAASPDAAGDFQPLAVVSVRRPITSYRMYALQPQAEGVGGWIVFGSGVSDKLPLVARFSSPAQSRLTPRAGRSYSPLPVSSLQAFTAADRLTGVITLRTTPPLIVESQARVISGTLRDCIVIRLEEVTETISVASEEIARVLGVRDVPALRQFAGPCADRPESGNCGDPQPIEFVNGVRPDCDGVLTIEFQGCAEVTHITSGCGIAVDCGFGLSDACFTAQIPNADGTLPNSDPPTLAARSPSPEIPVVEVPGESESASTVGGLPYLNCFETAEVSEELTTASGLWQWNADNSSTALCPSEDVGLSDSSLSYTISGSYESATAAYRNIAIWEGADDITVFRRVTTEVKLTLGPDGAKQNGGIILNYRQHETAEDLFTYYLVEVDYDTQEFRISRSGGKSTIPVTVVTVHGIQTDVWYRLTATIRAAETPGQTEITARLEYLPNPGSIDVTIITTVNDYAPSIGRFGLAANRALSRFAYLHIEEVA